MGSILTEEEIEALENHIPTLFRLWNEIKDNYQFVAQPSHRIDGEELFPIDEVQLQALQHAADKAEEAKSCANELKGVLKAIVVRLEAE